MPKVPQVKPDWATGIYIGNGVVAKPKYAYLPVDGCEQCEYNIEAVGDDAGACDECIAYGDAEKVEVQ